MVGFEEYLKYAKGPPSRLFLKFRSGTYGLFEELGRHANRMGPRNVLIVGLVRNLLSMFFSVCIICFSETKFFQLSEASSYTRSIQTFNLSSIFAKAVFCLDEKRDMLANDE